PRICKQYVVRVCVAEQEGWRVLRWDGFRCGAAGKRSQPGIQQIDPGACAIRAGLSGGMRFVGRCAKAREVFEGWARKGVFEGATCRQGVAARLRRVKFKSRPPLQSLVAREVCKRRTTQRAEGICRRRNSSAVSRT